MRFFVIALMAALAHPGPPQESALPVKPDSVRFAVIGDMGTGDRGQYDVANRMVEQHQKFPFDFVIMVGDNVYGGESPIEMQKKLEVPYRPQIDKGVKFYAALGNHDDPSQSHYEFFNMNGKPYYTFRKGNVRFFALNSNYMDPGQIAWLEKELEASGSDWKICYFHHPLYSSGRAHGSTTELRVLLEPIFVKHGVQVVFQGHEHMYERIKPQKGIYYFTEGASGKLKRNNLAKTEMTAAGFDTDLTFMMVEISGDELHFQTLSRTGAIVDSGTIKRPVNGQPVPAAVNSHPRIPLSAMAGYLGQPQVSWSSP